jgi:alpha-amylase
MKTERYLILFFLLLLLSCENAIVSQEENIDFKDSGTRFYNTKEINQEHKVCSVYSEIALKNYANTVNTPVLSVPAGDFWNTITVFVTCDTTGDVSIYYTTDGSEPTSESIPYPANGIKIDKTATLKVVAYKDGLKCSETVTAEYTKRTAQTYNENTSGVMLQGFNWDSAANDGGYTLENKSPKWGKWYNVMLKNAESIKNTFEYVWFPPPSMTDTASSQGYGPSQLNNLNNCYGTEEELKKVIQAIQPAKAIADIVVNHRAGTKSWADFSNPRWTNDYSCICADDVFFAEGNPGCTSIDGKGNKSTGVLYEPYRNLDHTNETVQQGIYSWMNSVLKRVGFVGWRYDFVKGFGGEYVGYYNAMTQTAFSVGEYWPDYDYGRALQDNAENWKTEIGDWIKKTSESINNTEAVSSRAFDFVLKRNLNEAFGWYKQNDNKENNNLWNMSLLASEDSLVHSNPANAVTFVDNHDTGSTQQHWELNWENVPTAYAFILTHPGFPCVAWQHYFTCDEDAVYKNKEWQYRGNELVSGTNKTFREHIDYLIELRKSVGIKYNEKAIVLEKTTTNYAAKVSGTHGELVVKIGGDLWSPTGDGYDGNRPIYSGRNFAIWKKGVVPTELKLKVNTDSAGLWNDDTTVFAWVWGGSHGNGEWVKANSYDSEKTFNVTVFDDATGFLLTKCKRNTTCPSWDNAGDISYKSLDISFKKGITEYSINSFVEYTLKS